MKPRLAARWPVVSVFILALLASASLWGPGLVNTRAGGDSPFLLWRAHQMAVNLRAGVFLVRWMPDAAYGYGYPFFSYYAALPFYLAGLFNVIGIDILTAIKLTQTLGFIAAAFAMAGWARRHFAQAGAWLAAVAYTFASFHLVNVYTRGDSLSEFYAFIFFPLILWAIDRTAEGRDARSIVALAFAFGGLFVTHNLSALIFSPFVALYIMIRVSDFRKSSKLLLCVAGLVLGLALSAWNWAPYFFERDYGQLGEQTTGFFNYSNHFRGLDLVQPTLAFNYDVGKTTPFAMSSVQVGLAILGVGIVLGRAIRRRKLDALSTFTLVGLFISTFMITSFSKPLWDHVPLLPIVQFPWRFLTVQAVFTALATAQIVEAPNSRVPNAQDLVPTPSAQYIAVLLGLLLAINALANLHPTRLYINPSDVTVERLQLYEMFTANIGTTIRYEYLPRSVVPRLYTSDALIEPGQPMRAVALEGEASVSRVSAAPTQQTWRATVNSPSASVIFPILWWPGWQATVDGKPATIRPANSSGRIVLDVPSGEHTVLLSLGRTPLRAAAESISLVAFVIVLALLPRPIPSFDEYRSGMWKARLAPLIPRVIVWAIVLALSLALLVQLTRSIPSSRADDETMDFISQPYLHHNPDGVEVSPGLRLMTYDFSADELQAGRTLTVTLNWRNTSAVQPVTVTLVSPAQHLIGLESAPAFAQSVATVSADQSMHVLPIPAETPPGVYLVQVQGRGDAVYLRPVRIRSERPAGDAPVLAQFGDRIRLHRMQVEQLTPTQLAVTLVWSAAKPVEANYAVSVRLRGVASIDTQPGYGFLPTGLWRPGELISDRYNLKLPEGTPPRKDYEIQVLLYDAATLASIGQYVQMNVVLSLYSGQPVDSPVLSRLGPELALATLDFPTTHQEGAPTLGLKAGWLALMAQSADRIARWTIYDASGIAVFTQTHDLVAGLPSSTWPAGAFVVGETQLNIPAGLAPGHYRLGVTVLSVLTRAEEGTFLAPSTFEIVGHPRSFTVPPMQHTSEVEFGKQIRLLGYGVKSQISNLKSQITVTLYWQAVDAPKTDYKVFVHLFDPSDEHIATQHDAMPLDGQYPTSWWATGEIVSDTVALDLTGVKPGTYRLAVGLYDAQTATRLEAVTPSGARLDADRAVLPEAISLK